jgi:hypothetical protein
MIHRQPRTDSGTIPDRELGIAAMLLLLTVVLTVAVLPSFL